MDYQGLKTGGVGGGGEEEGETEEEEGGDGDDGAEELEEGGGPVTRHYPLIHWLARSFTRRSEREREREI